MNRSFSLALAFVLFAFAAGGYAFLAFEINSLVSSAAAAKEGIVTNGVEEIYQQNIAVLLQDTESQRAELSKFIPEDKDVVNLIQMIEIAAEHEKVSASVGSVSVENTDWQYHEPLKVTLTGEGSYAALEAFATDLETLPLASHLAGMTITADAKAWSGEFTLEFVKEKTQTP